MALQVPLQLALAGALGLLISACVTATGSAPSLYDRMGGEPIVGAVVSDMLDAMVSDPQVNQSFERVNMPRLKRKIAVFICDLSDGPCTYTGDVMDVVHAGLNIREKEFYALVENLRVALDSNGVSERDKNELLRRLAPLKHDVMLTTYDPKARPAPDAQANTSVNDDLAAEKTAQ